MKELNTSIRLYQELTSRESLKLSLEAYFTEYGIMDKYDRADKTLICESNYQTNVWSWNKSSFGVAQFTKATWKWFNELRGTELDYNNPHDQIEMFSWAWSKDMEHHWDCFCLSFELNTKRCERVNGKNK